MSNAEKPLPDEGYRHPHQKYSKNRTGFGDRLPDLAVTIPLGAAF